MGNGAITLDAGATINNSGLFIGDSKFLFISGTLAGTGTYLFNNINFTSPALKTINGTTNVTGILFVDPGKGGQGTVNVAGGVLTVSGTLRTTETLTISAIGKALINIPGLLSFMGTTNNILTVRGTAHIRQLTATGGTVTINDNVTITNSTIGSGAILNLIGDAHSTRSIGDITGLGQLLVAGGINNFTTMSGISNVQLTGGTLVTDSKTANIGTLLQNGGQITGKATIIVSTATLANAGIVKTPVVANDLELKGFTSLNGASLSVTGLGIISASSQFTLSEGATFIVTRTARVSQSAPLRLLPSGADHPAVFQNDGRWTSTSDLEIVVTTNGTGAFEFGTGATTTLTGIHFRTQSLSLTGSKVTVIGSVVNIGSIDGRAGTVDFQGSSFTVQGNANIDKYTHENGDTTIGTGNFGSVDVQTGNWNITGLAVTIGQLTFEGGQISSTPGRRGVVTVSTTIITGNQPKTFSDVEVTSSVINLVCGTQQCQLFTKNAIFATPSSELLTK